MEFPDTLIKGGNLSCVDYLQISGVSGNSADTLAEGDRGTIHGCLELLWTSSKDEGYIMAILDHYVCLLCGGVSQPNVP